MTIKVKNSQDYLNRAAHIILKEIIKPVANPAVFKQPKLQITSSFAYRSKKAIGQCFAKEASDSKEVNLITINPSYNSKCTLDVLEIVHHELIHASDNCASGHRGYFRATAIASGLTGKMTATIATPELKDRYIELIVRKIGTFPWDGINTEDFGKKKQTVRNCKVSCFSPECDFSFRTSRKNVDQIVNIVCPACTSSYLVDQDGEAVGQAQSIAA